MNYHKFLDKFITLLFIIFLCHSVNGHQRLTVGTGGGYSSNLYSDSFGIGDSYMLGAISISDTELKTTKFKMYYDLVYYQYDSRNSINQFDHLAGLSLFRKRVDEKFKWGIDLAGTYRDYTQDNSDFDNYKIFLRADASYYLKPGLQLKFLHQVKSLSYSGFDNLDHYELRFKGELVKTFPSRTTARGRLQYSYRNFDIDNSNVSWLDLEIKVTQSVNIKTGVSASGVIRVAGNGTRPLSSYSIMSGITPYWDPWDGYQLNFSVKNIFPLGIIGIADFDYWDRQFNYSEILQSELPWLSGQDNRNENGWAVTTEIKRQFNLNQKVSRVLKVNLKSGFVSNESDEIFYSYNYFYTHLSIKLDIY